MSAMGATQDEVNPSKRSRETQLLHNVQGANNEYQLRGLHQIYGSPPASGSFYSNQDEGQLARQGLEEESQEAK